MMRAPLSTVLLGAALAILTAAACGYNPNPESGTLQCGPDNTCPQNYTCRSGLCWRDGAGGSTGTGGTGGGDPPSHFIGVWVSDPSLAKRVRVCNDGTNETLAWDDYLDITGGGPALLRTNYYCDWDLDLNVGGTATVIRPGAMCTKPDMNDPSIMFTWHGESLTLTTTNGTSGTLDMSLPYEYTTTTGSGSCTLHFTGPMTKS